jgi:DNA segregation ATPase FtsK/SpoIIIE, S-DNA-T family
VKKGRSVAMLTVLIAQKQTGDAIPTAVRDVCQFSLSYACKTEDAAVAALGADIRNHAKVSPVRVVGREHVVAVASLPGRPGFTRIRTPNVAEEHGRRAGAGRQACAATPPPCSRLRARELDPVRADGRR